MYHEQQLRAAGFLKFHVFTFALTCLVLFVDGFPCMFIYIFIHCSSFLLTLTLFVCIHTHTLTRGQFKYLSNTLTWICVNILGTWNCKY